MMENKIEIQEFDYVVLKKDTNMKVVQTLLNKPVSMCKMKFTLNGIVGSSFGSSFIVQNGQLAKVDICDVHGDGVDQDSESVDIVTRDNRQLVDSGENQQLTKDEIILLRKQGVSGEEIVGQLIENSATFARKTEFSQQKYIKKKKQKHVAVFTVLKPTARTLVELYYNRGPTKICNLRLDSLSQILTYCNVRAGSRLMIVESCNGLLLGAVLERLAGSGTLIHMYTGSAPSRQAVTDGFHFSDNYLSCLHSFPLSLVSSLRRPTVVDSSSMPPDKNSSMSLHSASPPSSLLLATAAQVTDASDIVIDSSLLQTEALVPSTDDACPAAVTSSMDTSSGGAREAESALVSSQQSAAIAVDSCNCELAVTAANNCSVQRTGVTNECLSGANSSSELPTTSPATVSHWTVDSRDCSGKRKWKQDEEEREKRKAYRQEKVQFTKSLIEAADMDGLIIAAKLHPTPIVLSLLDFVKPSRPIVIFSPYKEPLIDCFIKLRETGRVLLISVSETWFRAYQVLPDRTHPSINMSGSGGYLLTATTVAT
jgi:hypothetical protein